jgi:hypothetical protein
LAAHLGKAQNVAIRQCKAIRQCDAIRMCISTSRSSRAASSPYASHYEYQ